MELLKLPRVKQIIVLSFCIFIFLARARYAFAQTLNWIKPNGVGLYFSQDIKIAPSNNSIVFASIRNGALSGLLKSTDGGLNFTSIIQLTESRDIDGIAISFTNPDRLCISTYQQGVFCSKDGGLNFSNAGWQNSNIQAAVRYIAVDPNNDSIFFAGTGTDNTDGGVYKSVDGGDSWTRVGASTYNGLNTLNVIVDKFNSNEVFAGSDGSLFRSYDGGANWSPLSVSNTNSPATMIDKDNSSIIYTASHPQGIYKSTNNGDSWLPKNVGIEHVFIFRLSQDTDGYLYGSQIGNSIGVWRSKDAAETWDNIADSAWATASASIFGLDVKNRRIIVGVANLGIYVANTDGSPITPPTHKACVNYACTVVDGAGTDGCQTNQECVPPGPNPVVVIPGFGGSWSYKGLIQQQPTTYSDWELFPKFSDYYYQPLLNTLSSAGLLPNVNLFTFAYDYRMSLWNSANWLNGFLADKLPGKKINIVGHSMGGLVASYCVEFVPGCHDKINKIITGGSPFMGALDAYQLWEGGQISVSDPMVKTAEQLLLWVSGRPWILNHDIARSTMPGVRDLLPIFDYLEGRPYSLISFLGKNWDLESLINSPTTQTDLAPKLTAFSGINHQTPRKFNIAKLNPIDSLIGVWTDGKPSKTNYGDGDGTVLRTSSSFGVANKFYPLSHSDYFNQSAPLSDLLTIFGLPGSPVLSPLIKPDNFRLVYATGDVTISAQDKTGSQIGTIKDGGKSIFINGSEKVKIVIAGQKDSGYELNTIIISPQRSPTGNKVSGLVRRGQILQRVLE